MALQAVQLLLQLLDLLRAQQPARLLGRRGIKPDVLRAHAVPLRGVDELGGPQRGARGQCLGQAGGGVARAEPARQQGLQGRLGAAQVLRQRLQAVRGLCCALPRAFGALLRALLCARSAFLERIQHQRPRWRRLGPSQRGL